MMLRCYELLQKNILVIIGILITIPSLAISINQFYPFIDEPCVTGIKENTFTNCDAKFSFYIDGDSHLYNESKNMIIPTGFVENPYFISTLDFQYDLESVSAFRDLLYLLYTESNSTRSNVVYMGDNIIGYRNNISDQSLACLEYLYHHESFIAITFCDFSGDLQSGNSDWIFLMDRSITFFD